MKPIATALSGGLAAAFTTLQATAGTTAAVQTVTALVGGATIGGILLHLVRRVNAIPAEEALKRHDAVNRVTAVMAENYDRLDEARKADSARLSVELDRMEARLMGAINANSDREAGERHRLEDRVRDVERELPPRGPR